MKLVKDCVKLNVYATFHPNDLQGAVGVVLWCDKAGFLSASNDCLEDPADAKMAGAYALQHVLC